MPPDDLATRSDLLAMEGRFDERLTELDRRWDERLAASERRWDERFVALDEKLDERWARLEAELKASFRGELNAALVSQTRTVVFSTLGAVVSMSGVAFALATTS